MDGDFFTQLKAFKMSARVAESRVSAFMRLQADNRPPSAMPAPPHLCVPPSAGARGGVCPPLRGANAERLVAEHGVAGGSTPSDTLRGRLSAKNFYHYYWEDFYQTTIDGRARFVHSLYFECFDGTCPSLEYWFQCSTAAAGIVRADNEALYEQCFADLPAREFDEEQRFVRGHVVLHIHFAGSTADPDFDRILHVNARFAVEQHEKHAKNMSPRTGFAIDGEGKCLTGGRKRTRMIMQPPWEWKLPEGESQTGGGCYMQYPVAGGEECYIPPLAEASQLHELLCHCDDVRLTARLPGSQPEPMMHDALGQPEP